MSVAAHRGAGPRHRDHHRRLRALRVRGHPGDGHRPADDPRVLALRHRRGLRQGAGEHQEPARRAARPTPSRPTSRSTRPWCARSTPRSSRCCRSARSCTSVWSRSAPGALKDLALALFVGMAAGAYSSIFIATPLVVQLKSGEKEITQQDAAGQGARQARRRPLRRRAGVHRRHAGARTEAGRRPAGRPSLDGRTRTAPVSDRRPTSGGLRLRPRRTRGRRRRVSESRLRRAAASPRRQPRSKRGK